MEEGKLPADRGFFSGLLDYTATEVLIRFPSGHDWSTFSIWIKREMFGQWLKMV